VTTLITAVSWLFRRRAVWVWDVREASWWLFFSTLAFGIFYT
jgi:hypothetical protein